MMAQSQTTMAQPMMQPQRVSGSNRVKIIVYTDIVFDVIGMLYFILPIFIHLKNIDDNKCFASHVKCILSPLVYAEIIVPVVLIIIHGLAIWISVLLLKATNPTTVPNQSLKNAKIWELYSLVFILFLLVGGFIFCGQDSYLIGVIMILGGICRAPLLYMVHKFVLELKSVGAVGNPMAYTTSQYQQHPSQYQQQPQNQDQAQP